MAETVAGPAARLEHERRRARAQGASLPDTPVVSARRIATGRSTDPVWWVNGTGWNAVVKVVSAELDPAEWDTGTRELAAHRTGLLATLPPGVRAPRCLGLVARDDGSTAMWLEGVEGPTAPHWPLRWYAAAAAGTGRMQGAYVVGTELPQGDWLNRGSIAEYLEEHPCDGDRRAELRCDDVLLDALERLPRTVCHFDLHPRNLVVGDGDVVVLDWSSVGIGTLGEDPSTLVASAVLDGHVAPGRLREVFAEVTAGYATGLRQAGLDVDDAALARALGALLVVRLGWVVERRLRSEDAAERPAAEALVEVLGALAAEARRAPPTRVVSRPRSVGA